MSLKLTRSLLALAFAIAIAIAEQPIHSAQADTDRIRYTGTPYLNLENCRRVLDGMADGQFESALVNSVTEVGQAIQIIHDYGFTYTGPMRDAILLQLREAGVQTELIQGDGIADPRKTRTAVRIILSLAHLRGPQLDKLLDDILLKLEKVTAADQNYDKARVRQVQINNLRAAIALSPQREIFEEFLKEWIRATLFVSAHDLIKKQSLTSTRQRGINPGLIPYLGFAATLIWANVAFHFTSGIPNSLHEASTPFWGAAYVGSSISIAYLMIYQAILKPIRDRSPAPTINPTTEIKPYTDAYYVCDIPNCPETKTGGNILSILLSVFDPAFNWESNSIRIASPPAIDLTAAASFSHYGKYTPVQIAYLGHQESLAIISLAEELNLKAQALLKPDIAALSRAALTMVKYPEQTESRVAFREALATQRSAWEVISDSTPQELETIQRKIESISSSLKRVDTASRVQPDVSHSNADNDQSAIKGEMLAAKLKSDLGRLRQIKIDSERILGQARFLRQQVDKIEFLLIEAEGGHRTWADVTEEIQFTLSGLRG